jgi:hypothetical protein
MPESAIGYLGPVVHRPIAPCTPNNNVTHVLLTVSLTNVTRFLEMLLTGIELRANFP